MPPSDQEIAVTDSLPEALAYVAEKVLAKWGRSSQFAEKAP